MSGWDPWEDIKDAADSTWSGLNDALSDVYEGFIETVIGVGKKLLEEAFRILGVTGETLYVVQMTNVRLVTKKQRSFVQKIIFQYVFDDVNLINNFLLSLNTGIHSTVKKYRNYGENFYVNGLPTATNSVSGFATENVDTALTSIEGVAITVATAIYSYLPANEWVKWWLQENTAFTYHDNKIIVGADTYLYDTYTLVSGTYTANFNLVSGTGPTTYSVTLIPVEDITKPFIIAIYVLDSAPTLSKIWIYDRDSGVYPDLDTPTTSGETAPSTLPIVPLRKNFVDLDDPSFAVEYESSRRLLKKLEINIDDLIGAIRGNPDENLIEDAFYFFGLNIYSESSAVIRALIEYFLYMELIQTTSKTVFDNWPELSNPITNTFGIVEGDFNTTVQYNYINTTIETGSIGVVGTVTSTVTILATSPIYDVGEDGSSGWATTAFGTAQTTYGGIPQSYIVYQKQLTATTYSETVVHGLGMLVGIRTRATYFKIKYMYLEAPGGVDRDNFTIPLAISTLTDLEPVEQEEILYEAMTLSVYAVNSVELAYYETSGFAVALSGITAALTIIFAPAGATFSQFTAALVKNLVYQYALTLVLKEILRHNLSDDERVLVLALYAVASVGGANTLSLDFSKLDFAETFLFSVNSVTTALMLELGIEFKELQAESELYGIKNEERQEALAEANSRFSAVEGVNPLLILKTYKPDPYETPSNFYHRTTHIGNPGVISLDQISNYHNKALELPQLN